MRNNPLFLMPSSVSVRWPWLAIVMDVNVARSLFYKARVL